MGLYALSVAVWNTILFKAGIPASVVPADTRLLLPPERSCTALDDLVLGDLSVRNG